MANIKLICIQSINWRFSYITFIASLQLGLSFLNVIIITLAQRYFHTFLYNFNFVPSATKATRIAHTKS